VTLRPGRPSDVDAVAQLHAGAIAEGFLSSLGPRFLRRLYRRILREPGSFLVVAEDDGVVAGFIAGSLSLGRLYRSFLVRDGTLAVLGAPGRVLRSLPRLIETLRHGGPGTTPGEKGDGAAAGGDLSGGELLSVAVDPAWRGRGVGGALVVRFIAELEARGVASAHVVLGADNAPATALYQAAGFHAARTFEMHKGTTSLLMARAVGGGGASPSGSTS
jgi:ribosomal protein S18 acetylase RimI-like enzyme